MIPTLQMGSLGRRGGAGAAPLTPHRYWRLLITANDGSGSYCGLTELELRETVGGTDWGPSYTSVAASSEINGGNAATFAFNNSPSSGWLSSVPTTSWIENRRSPSSGDWKKCAQIVIWGSYNVPSASPKDFQLQWSDDDVSWTTVLTVTGQTGWTGASDQRTFNVP